MMFTPDGATLACAGPTTQGQDDFKLYDLIPFSEHRGVPPHDTPAWRSLAMREHPVLLVAGGCPPSTIVLTTW